jgi:hypothetical protein
VKDRLAVSQARVAGLGLMRWRRAAQTGVPHFIASAPPQVDAAARTAFAGLPGALVWEVERAG